jgi:competence protein ComEA
MSDPLSELPRPVGPPSWRDRLAEWAESLDLTPTRLVGGAAALVVVGLLGWKLLAPPPTPPEMRLPFVSTTAPGPESSSATTAQASPAEVVVHVAGAVLTPGVQHLAAGTRVVDALEAAGGASPDADLSRVNLAALLEDGQQVYVPVRGESPPPAAGSAVGDMAPAGPVDLNTADVAALDALPGIGPALAQAIVDHRDRNGRFQSVDQLVEVRGIGEAKLEQLRPLVTV